MIGGAALHELVPTLSSRPLRDTWFRAMRLKFARDPLGRGRPIAAQRFNLAAGARVLYLGDDQVTCLHEVQAFGLPPWYVALAPVNVQLEAVLDLRDAKLQAALSLTTADIRLNFRRGAGAPPTDMQKLGEELAASHLIDGLLYESLARPGHACLAVFEASLAALGSFVEVNDPGNGVVDRLP